MSKALRVATIGLEGLDIALRERTRRAANRVGFAVGDGARKVQKVALDYAGRPFSRRRQFRNVQDHRRRVQMRFRKSVVQARIDLDKQEAQIMVRPHATPVSPTVRAVAEQTGNSRKLQRRHLYVARGRGGERRNRRGHPTRAGLQRTSIRTPWLQDWMEGKDLEEKDTVRLKGEMLRRVVMLPALEKHRDQILRDIREAVEKSI